MSVLDQSVKKVMESLEGTGEVFPKEMEVVNFQALLEEERAGKNRKILVKWLEKQDAQGSEPTAEAEVTTEQPVVDASVPEVEPVYEAPPTAPVRGLVEGEYAISDLIALLSEKRDSLQRSTSCGVENIRVHLSEIRVTVR